jgi:hypothetical protein
LDVSNSGAAFLLLRDDPVEGLIPGSYIREIRIGDERRQAVTAPWGVVRYARVLSRSNRELGYRVGVEFGSSFDALASEVVRGEDEILKLVREAVAERRVRAGSAIGNGGLQDVAGPKLGDDRRLILTGMQGTVGDVVALELDSEGSRLRLLAGVTGVSADGVVVRLPEAAERTVRRGMTRRGMAPDRRAFVAATSPVGGRLRRRPVIDITGAGLAFPLDDRTEVLPVGAYVEDLQLSFSSGASFELTGIVRSLVPLSEAERPDYTHKCGIEFGPMTAATRARLADSVTHARHPEIEDAAGQPFDAVWRCLEMTGFIYPEKAEKLRDVMPELRRTNSAILETPNRVGKTLIFRSKGRVVGHISALRLFSRTFLCQHLAVAARLRDGVSAARLLNLGLLEYIEQIPEMEWVRVYYRPANRWAQRVFGSLSNRLDHLPVSNLELLDYLQAPAGGPVPASESIQVRPARGPDLDAIEQYFVEHRPFGVRAEDLSKERIELRQIATEYAAIGLVRRREVMIAELRGRPVAFALLEVSSIGLNFSEITNTFRVYAFTPDAEQADDGRRALIGYASRRYAALGRRVALALAEPGDRSLFESSGFTSTKQYACWSWHRATYRAYYEHLERVTERRR